jgi:AcrR family transcriptional regulator
MPARPYRMVRRARAAEETREAIIGAAAALFSGDGWRTVSVDGIAVAAGVSRATVYQHVGSRRGLIEAVTTAAEQEAGFGRVLEASRDGEPRTALEGTLGALVRFVHATGPLFHNLRALSRLEPDLEEMVRRKERERRRLIRGLVHRAASAGELRVPEPEAAAVLVALTNYEALRELLDATRSGAAAQRAVASAVRSLFSP